MKNKRLIATIQSTPIKLRVYRLIRAIVVWFLFGALINLLLSYVFYTPKSYYLNIENKALAAQISSLGAHIEQINKDVKILQYRYINIYKPFFGLPDNIDYEAIFEMSNQKYNFLRQDRYKLFVEDIYRKNDVLNQNIVSLTYSLDSISKLAKNKDLMLESLPMLLPIHKDDIGHISDQYGLRFHPIYKKPIFHKGLDIACRINTPVYAPADGVVKSLAFSAGYGKMATLDHGYGYVTRYAHLNAYKVKRGDRVKKGEVIALSGNTGNSTGAHLHYEVLFNNKNVNPINYISNDMTTADFAKIIESAKIDTLKSYENLEKMENSNVFVIQ